MNRRRRTACLCRVLLATLLLGNALAPLSASARASASPSPSSARPAAIGRGAAPATPAPSDAPPTTTPTPRTVTPTPATATPATATPTASSATATATATPTASSATATATTKTPPTIAPSTPMVATATNTVTTNSASATPTTPVGAQTSAAGVAAGARSVLLVSPLTSGACPSGWTCADIGSPALAGGQSLSGGTWTVQGSGDLYGSSDQFHFVWQTVAGDGGVTARVITQTTTASPYAKAGVMLRQDSSAGAPFYDAFVASSGFVDVLYRPTAGANAVDVGGFGGGAPVYLKVARVGSSYTAYTSSDGLSWTAVPNSAVSIAMTGATLGGLAVASSNVNALETATVDSVLVSACPAGWSCADVGSPALPGGQSFDGAAWTVQGGGYDIWGASDGFHYVWQPVPSDGAVSARVVTQTVTDQYAKAGVMLRQDTSAGSAFYDAIIAPSGVVDVEYRATPSGAAASLAGLGGAPPVYLRVARVGNTYTAYTSNDGVTWTALAGSSVTLSMTGTLLGGLAVTAHNGGAIGTAQFDSVTVNACPSGWTCADIGNLSVPGGQSLTAGAWQVQGAGAGIFGSSDEFHYAWQNVAGDAAISARVLGQTNTNQFAKAGVMLRQDSSPGAAYYFAYVTPGPAYGGVNVEVRSAAGATTVGLANPGGQPPVYLKVARAGTTYTAYSSADGVAWTAIPGSTVTFTATNALLAGLAVTSDCPCQVSTGTFDSVAVTSRSSGDIPWHPHQSVTFGGGLAARVDLADGHVDVAADDLSVPGRRLGLALGHTWDSWLAQHGGATAAGPGWISDLTPSMGGVLTQTVVYTDASGARWDFPYQGAPGGSGPYTAYGTPPGRPWLLSTAPLTGYVLTDYLSGESWSFDAQGRYATDTDAYGNQNTMTQGPSGVTAETNSGGRALAVSYSNGLLSDAQSPLWQSGGAGAAGSQHVSYGYNAQGQLTTLTRGAGTPDALTATFGYSGTQLVTVTTPAQHVWALGYDGQGRLTTISSPVSGTLGQTGYTPAYTTQLTYGATATQVIRGLGDSGALTTTTTLDALGQATQTQDGLGHTTHAAYDADHDVTSSSDANGNTTTDAYSYVGPGGSYGLRTQTTLPAVGLYVPGNTPTTSLITNRYDPATHDLLETDKPEGGVTLYAYDAFHSPITTTMLASDQGNSFCPNAVVRAPGAPTVQPLGTCSYVQQWRASVTHYDQYGQRTSAVDGRGFVPSSLRTTSADGSVVPPTPQLDPVQAPLYTRTYSYTPKGDLQSESTPPLTTTLNGVATTGPVTTTYGYDGDGHQTGVTAANGATTTTAYDHLGRQTSTTLPQVTLYNGSSSTPTSSTGYDADGNVIRSTNANGETTTSSDDPWQRLVASTNPVSGTTLYTYTATEQTAVRDPQGNVTQSAYDAAGRLSQTTDPSHNTTQYQYDAVGNTVALTSGTAGAASSVETRTYDARNEVATDTTSGPGLATPLTTQTAYDGDGNVAQVQQPNGDTVYHLYDLSDLPTSTQTDPSPVSKSQSRTAPKYETYAYDAAGNQVSHTDADNRTDSTMLDADNRTVQDVATALGPGGTTTITTTNSFDPDGNTVSWTRQTQPPTGPVQTGTDSATYDAADRQTSSTDNGLTTAYGYDAAGQQRTHTIADGTTLVTTSLDPEGRQTGLSEGMGGARPYTGRMGYNANDLPVTMTLPGGSGVQEGMGYDASSRLVTQTLTGPASSPATTTLSSAYAYGYNPLNWTTSTTTLSGTDTLVHDAQGRLTSESGPQVVATGGAYKWTYDANGNLLSQIGDDGYPVTYTYTSAITPNEVQTMVMGDGQPTAYYAYDAHGDTTAITDGALLNTHIAYDSQARPVQITKLDHGTPLTVTLSYNPSGQRASSHVVEPGQPTLDQQFTYRDGVLGQVRLTSGTTAYTDTYLYTDAGAPYELLRTSASGSTSRYWYEVDGRGNVVALTDSTGKVVDRYAYDNWGELTSNDATDETVPQQLRYAGYWYDEKLSWYWLSVRYYDPEIERFLAPDPSEQDGVRTYAYVGDDPIDATDPSGLDTGAGSAGSPVDDFIEAFTLFAGAVVVVARVQSDLIGTTIHAGGLLLIAGKDYVVSVIKYGNPASIPVPCTTGPPPIGTIAPSPIPGGTTVPGASSCTAATAIPIYTQSVTVPNSVNASGHTYIPAPKSLPAFPTAKRAKSKTPYGGGLRIRWVDDDGNIYEWDSQHGKVEKYDRRGRHLGEFDPVTGKQTKDADPTRRVQP